MLQHTSSEAVVLEHRDAVMQDTALATDTAPLQDTATVEYAYQAGSGSAQPLRIGVRTTRSDLAPASLYGLGLRKFRDSLRMPPLIRAWRGQRPVRVRAQVTEVQLHADLPAVPGWGYNGSIPGPTIEVRRGRPTLIDWENGLGTITAPEALPFDVVRVPLLPSGAPDFLRANSPGGCSTSRGSGADAYPPLPGCDELIGATVVHLHGALTNGHDDGWAHNVALPGGVTRCRYPNDQEATTLWYHDHAMAVTRFNVHAGLAGFYLIRDEVEDALCLPSGDRELTLMIADRNLETRPTPPDHQPIPSDRQTTSFTGRLLYKHAAFAFGPGTPIGEIPVTGPFNTVNGTIWPTHAVQARWYRLRVVNASGTRIHRLALHDTTDEVLIPGTPVLPDDPAFSANRLADALVVIGTDGGLLPAPVRPDGVIELGPGERLDLLVDFGALRGRTLELRNENGSVLNAQPGQADATIMQFTVSRRRSKDHFVLPDVLNPHYRRYTHEEPHEHVWVAVVPPGVRGSLHPELWELAEVHDEHLPASDLIRVARADGSVLSLHPVAKMFDDATTIFLAEGDWAVWNILHLGGPDHPMHIHMTEFQMISRRAWPVPRPGGTLPEFDPATGSTRTPLPAPASGRPIDALAAGSKDTWVVKAGEWVQMMGRFVGATGSFMYHCHILDHEDHTMMRPFVVLPRELLAFHRGHGGGHHG